MNLTILIPAYNEENTIGDVIDLIPKDFPKIKKTTIIVVDDGSTDKTSQIAKSKNAFIIKHSSNQGVGKSFQDGLAKAIALQSDILVTIDADGQFNPKEIPKLIQPIINKSADFVIGSRFIGESQTPKNMSRIKIWGNKRMASLISWFTKYRFKDVACGFRAYGQEAMLQLNLFGKFTYTQETLLDLAYKGLNIIEVPVNVKYFKNRKSRIANNVLSYALKTLNIIFLTIKNYKPLKFFGISGIIIFTAGLICDIFVFSHFLKTGSFTPYKIIGFLGAFLNANGIVIFFIGVLADLIDKVRVTQEKILYFEKKKYYRNEEN